MERQCKAVLLVVAALLQVMVQIGSASEGPPAPAGITVGRVLFDYIGANGQAITFDDVPVNASSGITYILGLSFAIDLNDDGVPQNGMYEMHLSDSALTPEAAKSWRAQYPNVRLSISIGGFQFVSPNGNTYPVDWYDPSDQIQWMDNAVSSLTTIIQNYGADGIDIDLEQFPNGTDNFVTLIGGMVKSLRDSGIIQFASFAPGFDQLELYTELYNAFPSYFDILNYQFYGDEGLDTPAKYEARYKQVINSLPKEKLAPSTQTALSDTDIITGNDFYTAVKDIRSQYGIAGVFLWDADLSYESNHFENELGIAQFL